MSQQLVQKTRDVISHSFSQVKEKLKASTILRNTKIKQAIGTRIDSDGSMCAIGVLQHEMFGWDKSWTSDSYFESDRKIQEMLADVGMHVHDVCELNNGWTERGSVSFAELADILEEKGL